MLLLSRQLLQQHDFLQVRYEEDGEISDTNWSAFSVKTMAEAALVHTASVIAGAAFYTGKHDRTVCLLRSLIRRSSKVQAGSAAHRWCMQGHELFT